MLSLLNKKSIKQFVTNIKRNIQGWWWPLELLLILPDSKSFRVSHTICKTGKQNAPVFPLPVSAAINTSPPPKINGTASAWTSVGNLHKYIIFNIFFYIIHNFILLTSIPFHQLPFQFQVRHPFLK